MAAPATVSPPPGSTRGNDTGSVTINNNRSSDQRPAKVIPKGLRSFDEDDADFFLELLPGPRDREGLPDSIRFWKTRIETTDADKTFRVGLIYGPSGCGKSSLVKAGLLPRLAKHVHAVYIEATPDETETRLLNSLRRACPRSVTSDRPGRFPDGDPARHRCCKPVRRCCWSWTSSSNGSMRSEVRRTRNWSLPCDSAMASMSQAVVMVRDDFWLAVSRFMEDLEIELIKGQNTALVDLFDPQHARKVLTAFGIAYGNLPQRTRELSRDQRAFLDQAIAELAQDGKVISVRLALFAEMVKGKPWTPGILA